MHRYIAIAYRTEDIMPLRKIPQADIKSKSRRYFEISLIISLLLIIAAFRFFPSLEGSSGSIDVKEEVVKVEDIENTRQENRPPPPPRPPIPIEAPSTETMQDVDISSEIDLSQQMTAPPEPPKTAPKEDEDVYFEAVEDQPTIIGGLDAIKKYLVYPDLAIRAGVEGTVTVLAYVDRNGNVTRAEVLRGIGGGCDEAAVEAVKKVKFTPGMQRGKPVNVKVAVPVRFRLTK